MVTCSYDGMDMVRKNTLWPWLILMPQIVWRVHSLHRYSTSTLFGSMLLMPNSDLYALWNQPGYVFFPSLTIRFWWVYANCSLLILTWSSAVVYPSFLTARHVVHYDMRFCSPQLSRVVIWVSVAFLSPQTSLPIDLSQHKSLRLEHSF